jgi:lia operon protein LiaF
MHKKLFPAFVLIALGLMFLVHNLGFWPSLGQLWATWWPLILIALGINHFFRPHSCRHQEQKDE